MSHRIRLSMRNVSEKSCRVNQKNILCSVIFFPENRALYEIMWKKYCTARQATGDNKIQHVLDVWWKTLHEFTESLKWSRGIFAQRYVNVAVSFSYLCLLCFGPSCIFNAESLLDWHSTWIHRITGLKYRSFYTKVKCGCSFSYHCLLSFEPFVVSGCLAFLKHLFFFFLRGWGRVLSLVTRLQVWQFRVQIPTGVRDLSFLQNVQTSSRAHSVSY